MSKKKKKSLTNFFRPPPPLPLIFFSKNTGIFWAHIYTVWKLTVVDIVIPIKAPANKIKILVSFIWNGPCICYLEWLFVVHLFWTTFHLGCLGGHNPKYEVRKMLGCSNKKYENSDFIRRRLYIGWNNIHYQDFIEKKN